MKGNLAGHIGAVVVTAGLAALFHVSHETLGAGLVLIAAIAAVCWAVGGTLWWLVNVMLRKRSRRPDRR